MKTGRILTVVGARPQFIKAAVVSRAITRSGFALTESIIHTGQHFDDAMSDVFFRELDIPAPAVNLGVGGGTNTENTARMMMGLESVVREIDPSMIVVYGDTDSTLAAALVAAKLHVPVAHVEAGLRSFNRRMPEEINRILTDAVSALLFSPTDEATRHLTREGYSATQIAQVGDVMFDATLHFRERARGNSEILARSSLTEGEYVVATIHRAENVDDAARLGAIVNGIAQSGVRVVMPLHPRTQKALSRYGLSAPQNLTFVPPVGYLDMTALLAHARAVLTDSGGVQKEAFFHSVPCITAREETEWVELITAGANVLVGADSHKIAHALAQPSTFPKNPPRLYGDGNAGELIARALAEATGVSIA